MSWPPISWQAIALLRFVSISSHTFCEAQLLSAYEQVYGPWNIKLNKNIFSRRRWHLETLECGNDADINRDGLNRRRRDGRKKENSDLQLLFPGVQRIPDEMNNEIKQSAANGGEKETRTYQFTAKSVRSASCLLNLEKDGKFTLSLTEDGELNQNGATGNRKFDTPLDTASFTSIHPSSPIHQPLRGDWYLTPNPYCVTDRHHDTLLLISESRMRRLHSSATIEKARVELRCKIWGRYGAGAVRKKIGLAHGRVRGRLTHGTIMIVKEEVDGAEAKTKLPTREVVGTFHGKTNVEFDHVDRSMSGGEELPVGEDGDDDEEDDFDFGDNIDEFGVLRPIIDE